MLFPKQTFSLTVFSTVIPGLPLRTTVIKNLHLGEMAQTHADPKMSLAVATSLLRCPHPAQDTWGHQQ